MEFNSSLLNDPLIKTQIKSEICTYLENNDNGEVPPHIVWDAAKAVLRGKLIALASWKKKIRLQRLQQLQNELDQLEKEHKYNQTQSIMEQIKKVQTEINMIYTQEIEKKIMFTKQKYYEDGSKSMKLLSRKLRQQQTNSTIFKIKDPENNVIQTKQEHIHKAFEKFYHKLYSRPEEGRESDIDTFLDTLNLPTLTESQNSQMTADITEEEVKTAIGRLKGNKSPGSDGFTAEWYKAFQKELIPILLSAFNWALKKAEIPPSWRQAEISVIPKEGKDKLECGSYRPISVLNVDYRLYTSIMAKRLDKFLPNLIHNDQTGFIVHRQTQDNIRRTLHIMHNIQQNKIKAMILSLDAEKAFDSVRWSYLYKVLEKFNFHETIIKSIQALYDNPIARIKINGCLTESFILKRGTRQGCAWSPLLFALYLEPLAQCIRQNKKILGININDVEHKIACYADDIIIYLGNPNKSLPELMKQFQDFGPVSGYKLNINKTEILTYNYEPPPIIKDTYSLKWNTKSIKYLGVNLTKNISKLWEKNYGPLHTKIREDLNRWSLVPFLSLSSRINSIKMNILPRFLYLFQTLPIEIEKKYFLEWDKMISRFIWHGKKPRIRFKTLLLSKERGGWALPSLRNYYWAAQIRAIVCWCNPKYQAQWKSIENITTHNIPIQAILADRDLKRHIEEINNPWAKHTLKMWNIVVRKYKLTDHIKILTLIAYDSNRLDSRFKIWVIKGITALCSIVEGGEIMTFQTLKERFLLENQDFYRYLQIRSYFNQKVKTKYGDKQIEFIDLMTQAYSSKDEACYKIISKIYKSFGSIATHSTSYVKQKWEKEGAMIITDEEWSNIWKFQWKSTKSLKWREFCWKNVIRFFITPKQTAHIDSTTPICWRKCGCQEANHYHLFWGCPNIKRFWDDILEALQHIFRMEFPLDCKMLYLGYIHPDIEQIDKYLLAVLLAASKKALTRKWMQQEGPTLDDWINVTKEIYLMEKITFSVNIKIDLFKKTLE
uniref:Reverse transcriptase domain-containing protein n=1 Tax=Astyanax mexicanus TaxID=7994 RepID=A0A3B1JE93_ASTMX